MCVCVIKNVSLQRRCFMHIYVMSVDTFIYFKKEIPGALLFVTSLMAFEMSSQMSEIPVSRMFLKGAVCLAGINPAHRSLLLSLPSVRPSFRADQLEIHRQQRRQDN